MWTDTEYEFVRSIMNAATLIGQHHSALLGEHIALKGRMENQKIEMEEIKKRVKALEVPATILR